MIKRRVRFIMPVDFTAENEQGIAEAIREFRKDPVYQSASSGDHGWWQWTQCVPYRKRPSGDPRE
jgi:hypothetical protein